jgi:hypothetical protein
MAPSLPQQGLFRLSALPKYIPPGRNGKRRHASAAYRYAKHGVRGIRLKTWSLPDGLYTTLGAWEEFVLALTAARDPDIAKPLSVPPRSQEARHRAVEAEIERVRESIHRRLRQPDEMPAEDRSQTECEM